jgi:DNA-binding response OmpR family regulator
MKILVVDDDLALADVISFILRRAGFDVLLAYDGLAALERWQCEAPDIILLDLNLPKLDGLKVCQRIRAQADTPIIVLSVRSDEDDVVQGLKLGADDYIVKPFGVRQMLARIEAVLRRSKAPPVSPEPISNGGLTLDPSRLEVHCGEKFKARLTQLECRLLQTLLLNQGQVVPTEALIERVWGPAGGDRAMLKQLIYRLRRKLEAETAGPMRIEAVLGVGYSLQ